MAGLAYRGIHDGISIDVLEELSFIRFAATEYSALISGALSRSLGVLAVPKIHEIQLAATRLEWDKAIGMLVSMIDASQESGQKAELFAVLGDMFGEIPDIEFAIRAYYEAIRNEPFHAGALDNLGVEFNKLGYAEEALCAFEHALKAAETERRFRQEIPRLRSKVERLREQASRVP